MDLIKKHYEKVLMGVVLLGLTVAVVMLPFIISEKREDLEAKRVSMIPRPKPLPALDMSLEEAHCSGSNLPSGWISPPSTTFSILWSGRNCRTAI